MDVWRLLKHGTNNAFMNMAIDESIMKARIGNLVPNTIRFYRWKPSAISIGRFQRIEEEVQLDNCRKQRVDIVRRITGGGAVYHDTEDEITYSVVASKKDLAVQDVESIYTKIYDGLAEAVKILGLTAGFRDSKNGACPNLMIDGKKVSGSAQAHKRGVVLQHGTLLLNVDLTRMFSLLRVPWVRTYIEVINIARMKISSLEEELKIEISEKKMVEVLTCGFQKTLNIKLVEDKITNFESVRAESLCKEKYSTHLWNWNGKTHSEDTI